MDLGALAFDDPLIGQNLLSPLLGVLRPFLDEFAASLAIDFDVQVVSG